MTFSAPAILVIDDNVTEIRLLLEMLREEGYRFFVALTGEDGFRRALQHQPQLVLLDLYMPDMDGQATARLFHADPRLTHIPIVMLTGSNALTDKLASFSEGVVDYITKPFSAQEVAARLRVHLRRWGATPSAPRTAPNPATAATLTSALSPSKHAVSGIAPHAASQPWGSAEVARLQMLAKHPDVLPQQRWVLHAQALLLTHLAQPLNLPDLAHRVGTNERRLSEEFHRQTGKPVFEYLRTQRHHMACDCLLQTNDSITSIAEATGFGSVSAFSFAFRQRCGLTPSEFRASGGALP
ncbi:MAG: hypothetical protein RLZZ612_2571 [Pseudomonadota bacterium]|jgi:DNA-binding response OmpR family regulator